MSELAVAVASATGRSFNPVAGETKVSTANWYIAIFWLLALIDIGDEAALNVASHQLARRSPTAPPVPLQGICVMDKKPPRI
jgi:hypothetical protein